MRRTKPTRVVWNQGKARTVEVERHFATNEANLEHDAITHIGRRDRRRKIARTKPTHNSKCDHPLEADRGCSKKRRERSQLSAQNAIIHPGRADDAQKNCANEANPRHKRIGTGQRPQCVCGPSNAIQPISSRPTDRNRSLNNCHAGIPHRPSRKI